MGNGVCADLARYRDLLLGDQRPSSAGAGQILPSYTVLARNMGRRSRGEFLPHVFDVDVLGPDPQKFSLVARLLPLYGPGLFWEVDVAQPAGDTAAPDQTVAVLNTRDALKLWLITQEEKGALSAQKGRELWEQWKVYPSKAAAYFSVAQDLAMLHTIAKEFGSPAARVYVKEYKGKPYIILKGHPGIRKVLTGTRYGVEHPKVIGMRLGYRGAAASIREGGMLTVVLVSAFDVLDYFLSDNMTLADLVGQLASDFTKVAIATGVTLAASAALAGTVVASVALGPLLAAVVIGVGVGFALDALDNHFHLTERLKTMLNNLARNAQEKAEETRQGLLDMAADAVRALISEAVDAVVSSLEQYLWRRINDVQWYLLPRL